MPLVRSSSSERVWEVACAVDVVSLQPGVRRFAALLGFSRRAQWEVAIAASEAAANMVKHAGGGTLILRRLDEPEPGLELEARDSGPGILEPDLAFRDHISEGIDLRSPERPPRARGLGVGLGAIRRLMDETRWENLPDGGRLVARKAIARATLANE
jgi:serine/threonine-protein kinase RsbT